MVWAAVAQVAGAVSDTAVRENTKREKAAFDAVFDSGQGMTNNPDFRTTEAVFDNSGWNVSFGSSRISSTAEKTTDMRGPDGTGSGLTTGAAGLLSGLTSSPYGLLLLAGIGAAVIIAIKKRKG